MRLTTGFVLLAAVFCNGRESRATITAYTSKPAWSAAVNGSYASENFDSFLVSNYGSATLSSGITIGSTPAAHGFLTELQTSGVSTWHDQTSAGTSDATVFDFHRQLYGIGGDWDLTSYWIGTPNPLKIYLDNTPVPQNVTTTQFFGVVSSVPFSTIKVVYGGADNGYQNWDVDNLTLAPIPEPSSVVLATIGLVGTGASCAVACVRRRRKVLVG